MEAKEQPYRRNLLVLLVLQSLSTTAAVVLATVNGLAGLSIAPDRSLATIPTTAFVLGGAISTYFASLYMARFGRRAGFRMGALWAIAGAGICAYAMHHHRFWLLCFGSLVFGTHNAFAQYHRFAAAEAVSAPLRSRAISWVLAGGVVGAVLGPESTKLSKGLTSTVFVGSYLSLIAFALLALALTFLLSLPPPQRENTQRSVGALRLLRRLDVAVAVASAVLGYAVMVFLMTATPLAMDHHRHPFSDTAWVIEWHVLGMFVPSFVTGSIIRRVGVVKVILAGAAMMALCIGVNFAGVTMAHFWVALLLLGVGWNFMFIGGTTLLAESCTDQDKSVAQGTNEVLVFGANTAASLSAGVLLHHVGWQAMNVMALPFLLVVVALCVALAFRPGEGPKARSEA